MNITRRLNLAAGMIKALRTSGFLLAGVVGVGCASVGPPTVLRDRFDYVTTISESSKQQLLLNLLKVRYADAPVFMDVSSVISSYSREGELSAGSQIAPVGRGDTFGAIGVTGRYADKPTITYQPLAGDKFAKSLMTPIPIAGILLLIQSGYPADLVLRICVNRINGLNNAYGGAGNPREGDPRFRELMDALRESQSLGDTGFRLKSSNEGQVVVLFMRPSTDQSAMVSRKVRDLLGLSATEREFTVVPAAAAENDKEVAILTRSVLQIMIDFGSCIDVPESDVAEGRVYRLARTPEQDRLFPSLVTIHEGAALPENAYVSVFYRNRWFWIDDRDRQSKVMMTFLLLSFSLTESASTQPAPVVTIPAR